MNRSRWFIGLTCLTCWLLALACSGPLPIPTRAPTRRTQPGAAAPTVTSIVRRQVDQSMIVSQFFRLTITSVTHLSNAFKMDLIVENISGQPVKWAGDLNQAYLLDGTNQIKPRDAGGELAETLVIEIGARRSGYLIFEFPRQRPAKFYYPNAVPPFIEFQPPG